MDPANMDQLEERCRQLEQQVDMLNGLLEDERQQRSEEEGRSIQAAVQAEYDRKAYKRRHVHVATLIAVVVLVVLAFIGVMRDDRKEAEAMRDDAYQSGYEAGWAAGYDDGSKDGEHSVDVEGIFQEAYWEGYLDAQEGR